MNRNIAKVSGVSWNKDNGKFVSDFSNTMEIMSGIDPRKGNILKLIGVFFDPLDLITNRFTTGVFI